MSGKSSRRKGHNFERKIANLLKKAMPGARVSRGLQPRGSEVADVDCPVFWPELKIGKKPRIRGALRQSEESVKNGKIPLAIVKDDFCEEIVSLRLNDFLWLVSEWWISQKGIHKAKIYPPQEATGHPVSEDSDKPIPTGGFCNCDAQNGCNQLGQKKS